MDEAPFALGGHRVFVGVAQKPHVVSANQLVHRLGKALELALKQVDGPSVFVAAEDQFFFLLALTLVIDDG